MDPSDKPSKTQRKREMHDLQRLGEALVALKEQQLEALALPERLSLAVREAKRTKSFEAIRRQLQYIGRLMRDVDVEPIRAGLAALQAPGRQNAARLHLVEQWRERILEHGVEAAELKRVFPSVDLNALEHAVLAAREEAQNGRPPRGYRELFRILHQGLTSQTA